MDRISDSGSDDYGSTPYGDTFKSLYLAIIQHHIAISFFSYGLHRFHNSLAFLRMRFVKFGTRCVTNSFSFVYILYKIYICIIIYTD